MIISTAGFGTLVLFSNDSLYFWASFSFRGFSGIGEGCASTAIYSIIAIEF
jgi:hypothetical protein